MLTTAFGAEHARKKRFEQGVIEKVQLKRFKVFQYDTKH
jgi:hypothetical protein